MLADYLDQLYDLANPVEEDAIYEKIRQLAHQDREAFIAEVRELPVGEDLYLDDVYEALSEETENWEEFFLEELERLIDLSRSSPDPSATLAPLDAFFLLSMEEDMYLKRRIRARLYHHLDDAEASVRLKCVELLGDFLDETDSGELARVTKMVATDPDWRVQYAAYEVLYDVSPQRAKEQKLPMGVKIQARLHNLRKV